MEPLRIVRCVPGHDLVHGTEHVEPDAGHCREPVVVVTGPGRGSAQVSKVVDQT